VRREDWPLEDPKGKPLGRVREIRDDVRRRVVDLLQREGWEAQVIRPAHHDDRTRVEALLTAAGLPTDGVAEHFASFLVAEEGGTIVGAAGLELRGREALLRSVVVTHTKKGTGLGSRLTRAALDHARAQRARAVYLLTTTADAYFPRFGFTRVDREAVPDTLRSSREFQGACPASAIAMRLELASI
jgi:amino-acid N-acetyltransferase